ncbi:MAG: O-acetyl-ADP-ribose deacetylase [Caldiserica bacterium]|nr:O-acetyl-ADP-ribose deacetylase [Caldisericota bacterium]
MRFETCVGKGKLVLVKGDITAEAVDAIVNSANPELTPGGGVSGAIHRRGGPRVTEEAARIRRERGRLKTGEAVITTGGDLPAKWVIHTVGPVWHGGEKGEPELLAKAYRSCLELARERGLRTIAFPSISTGVYGYPVERAAEVALRAVKAFLEGEPEPVEEVRFVLFFDADFTAYREAWNRIAGGD